MTLGEGDLYGWQLVLLLPTDEQISWQGHLFGFLGGLVAAIVVRRRRDELPAPVSPVVTLPAYEPSYEPSYEPESTTRES